MNKAELIEALAQHYEGSRSEAAKALNAVVQTITRTTAAGDKVAITGFGVFEKVDRPARMVRNPRTGERKEAAATSVPRFRPGTELKAYVAGERELPASTGPVTTPVRRAPRTAPAAAPAAAEPAPVEVPAPVQVATKPAARKKPAAAAVPDKKAAKAPSAKVAAASKSGSKKVAKSAEAKDGKAKDGKDAKGKKKDGKKAKSGK